MPTRAPWICGCGRRVAGGQRCVCQKRRAHEVEKARPSARQRGYDSEWETARREFLLRPENRYCACGCGRRADLVDHGEPHRGDKRKFWDRSKWRPMAYGCHSSKTASRDGGFGNPRVSP